SARNYRVVDPQLVLKDEELGRITSDESLRKEIIEKGISRKPGNKRYFGGRHFVPYDKGGSSDINEGWLPNYYVPTDYYIDWSTEAVKRMKALTIADRIRLYKENKKIKSEYERTTAAVIRNPDTYFNNYLTFSRTGIYAPTFRLGTNTIYDSKSDGIFVKNNILKLLAELNSIMSRYLFKNFICHTVQAEGDATNLLSLIIADKNQIKPLGSSIISKQKSNPRYDYMTNEQVEIDRLVYQMYNLRKDDIKEIEDWFFRRYPKLARVIEEKVADKHRKN
ncbi:MAG: hypothetical protein ACOYU4_12540, partial [Thermodesulfobacteriota bacterium]